MTNRILITIYLSPGESVVLDGDSILLQSRPRSEASYPLTQIRSIVAFGRVDIGAAAIERLLAEKIPVVYFSGDGKFRGRLEPDMPYKADLLRAMLALDESKRLQLTQQIVWGALRQRRSFLQRWQRQRPGVDLAESLEKIGYAIKAVKKQVTVESVRGCLGSGMAAYYAGLAQAAQGGWEWHGRDTPTPLNSLITFSYSLVEQSLVTAIAVAGLDLHVGIWRSPRQRFGLVKDLATEFYGFADLVVLRCINRNQVALKDFEGWQTDTKTIPLQVREILVGQYQKKMAEEITLPEGMTTYQELILIQCHQVVALLNEEGDYVPVSIR